MDVPDNMATSAAFSDLLGPEPAHSFDAFATPAAELPIASVLQDEPPVPASFSPAESVASHNGVVEVPEFTAFPAESAEEWPPQPAPTHASEFEVTPVVDTELKVTPEATSAEFSPAAVEEAHSSAALAEEDGIAKAPHVTPFTSASSSAPAPSWPDTQPIPVYREPELQSVEAATPPASASTKANGSLSDVAEPANQVHQEQPKVAAPESPARGVFSHDESEAVFVPGPPPAVEPAALNAEGVDFDNFNARVEAQIREIETMVAAAETHSVENKEQGTGNREQEAAVKSAMENGCENHGVTPAEDDFEARVAAAMSIYDETVAEETEIGRAHV